MQLVFGNARLVLEQRLRLGAEQLFDLTDVHGSVPEKGVGAEENYRTGIGRRASERSTKTTEPPSSRCEITPSLAMIMRVAISFSIVAGCDMANPFPGMDPYFEGDLWTSVHTDLSAEIARQLAPKVRPKYVVLTTRRVVLAPADDAEERGGHRFPDVGVLTAAPPGAKKAAAMVASPLILPVSFPEPIPDVSVEVRDVLERRLVACIEVLSPTNKRGPGREEYEGNRLQVLSSRAHLLEIDLLRVGMRFPTGKPLPAVPYFVFLSRLENRKEVEVWPIALESRLPDVAVPLLPGDADAALVCTGRRTDDGVRHPLGYDELIDYTKPPPGPLSDVEMEMGGRATAASGAAQGERHRLACTASLPLLLKLRPRACPPGSPPDSEHQLAPPPNPFRRCDFTSGPGSTLVEPRPGWRRFPTP